ncbi:mannose-1-phosphate guanylyltransferase/mannose-6-phosphate isomerase [Jannaschia aquimarina]|uniref:mannose-1-phosphate guanylyltransferase n=1 Tax=Jannaschia aquimarina TaxID=935700 RepID=A0A0D1EHI6_9RHOB|nr:mannose-1-phosphate guanylyltransferase/mannose-6-phosphate isomerase [Jannaschia aquimarina]KIT16306.1 Alginate biosynthesis protein AlgA [Jannaschia aquimarina]SNT26506.1 mannose-1-phosphate guanylyltransferase/mannose-1-phosphate guanylyltransferase / mannose-6-phosphate isomerase [Jannaschia aquimarina]
MKTIVPVILCGGSGTRLWPLSRKSYPKQFAQVTGEQTLFQSTAQRMTGGPAEFGFADPVIVTNSDFRFIVTSQLMDVGVDPAAVLIEPEGRNTAPAVLAAALHLQRQDPDAIMLVAPSDHMIPDTDAYHRAVATGLAAVEEEKLCLFGIAPDRPETGYGYLELSEAAGAGVQPLGGFVEKPDAQRAAEMLASGRYLWNAGIFLFAVRDIVAAFERHAPTIMPWVTRALDEAQSDLGFLRLAPEPWKEADDISIDYAVMEKVPDLRVVPFTAGWSDLGDWEAVWRASSPDPVGVVADHRATAIDCEDTLLRSESDQVEVVGIGLKDIVAVAMNDAVLVAHKSRTQDVKKAVTTLRESKTAQAETFPIDHRPWGWFECLISGSRFQVKRIHVHPGAALSLQSHVHRSEHWIVVEGTARVTVDDDVRLMTENESIYVPLGATHRLENPGKVPMVLIEVQTGSYLGEDDIVRYEDRYARNADLAD